MEFHPVNQNDNFKHLVSRAKILFVCVKIEKLIPQTETFQHILKLFWESLLIFFKIE